jgi:hypothetical protein
MKSMFGSPAQHMCRMAALDDAWVRHSPRALALVQTVCSLLVEPCERKTVYPKVCVSIQIMFRRLLRLEGTCVLTMVFIVCADDNTDADVFRFPRHRTLISLNKRYTGRIDPEFNLRHDWNSPVALFSTLPFALLCCPSFLEVNVQQTTNQPSSSKPPPFLWPFFVLR